MCFLVLLFTQKQDSLALTHECICKHVHAFAVNPGTFYHTQRASLPGNKTYFNENFFFELSYEAIWRCAGKRGRDKGIKEIYQTAENEQNATTTKKNGLTYENNLK